MKEIVKKDISKFQKKFDYNYQPNFGFCPTIVKTNIVEFYDVNFEEAIEIYNEISKYPSAIIRFNDYLFENIDKFGSLDFKVKKS